MFDTGVVRRWKLSQDWRLHKLQLQSILADTSIAVKSRTVAAAYFIGCFCRNFQVFVVHVLLT